MAPQAEENGAGTASPSRSQEAREWRRARGARQLAEPGAGQFRRLEVPLALHFSGDPARQELFDPLPRRVEKAQIISPSRAPVVGR